MLISNNKKYFGITIFWVLVSTQIFCQSYPAALNYYEEGRYADAMQQINEYLVQNPKEVEALFLKSKIYYGIGSSKQYSEVVADGKAIAIYALKTATELDPQKVYAFLKQESFGLVFNLYNDLTNEGIIYFNSAAERKDKVMFDQALTKFKRTLAFSAYIFEHNWGLQLLDSNNLYYAAKSALYAGRDGDALIYAKKIVDNRIVKTQINSGFQPLYEWLVYYYRINQNEALLDQYSKLGMEQFPGSPFFVLNKIDWLRSNKQYAQMLPQYQLLFSKGFKSVTHYSAYYNDLFQIIFFVKDSTINKTGYKKMFEKEIGTYLNKNPSAHPLILLAGKYYRNLAAELPRVRPNVKLIEMYRSKSNTYFKTLLNKPKGTVNESILAEVRKSMN